MPACGTPPAARAERVVRCVPWWVRESQIGCRPRASWERGEEQRRGQCPMCQGRCQPSLQQRSWRAAARPRPCRRRPPREVQRRQQSCGLQRPRRQRAPHAAAAPPKTRGSCRGAAGRPAQRGRRMSACLRAWAACRDGGSDCPPCAIDSPQQTGPRRGQCRPAAQGARRERTHQVRPRSARQWSQSAPRRADRGLRGSGGWRWAACVRAEGVQHVCVCVTCQPERKRKVHT